ncbi:AAA family ATPase [Myroides sp. NP-2]|nr:AAA family ATPase [Myroides sp. NP-2]
MQIGDIVLIKKGKRKLLGYGEILSDYIFDAEREEYTSIRKVKWIKKGEWDIDFDLVLKTLTIITDYNSDVLKGQKYYQYLLSIMNGNINRVNSKRINLIKYKKQIILQGPPGTGKTREAKLIAKEMLNLQDVKDLEGNDQFKLIQFHPSYTYEDFVRGIVSKPNEDGDGIIYEAENKLLADFAQKALDNYIESNKTNVVVHEDSSIFEAFIENIKDELAQNEHHKYDITEAVYLFSADETRFKYKGDNWVAHSKGLNMKFSELKKIIDSGATERQDIKKMTDVEELTRQHATYFIKIVEKYYTFKQTFKESIPLQHSTELKNYVLLIDEINRANLSSVLGELIYALEYRGEAVESMYAVDNDNKLVLPPNLYIIGTMNTADRSVGHIDYAIRRRFAFVDVLPQDLSNDENIIFDSQLFGQVALLFDSNLSPEFEKKDVQLGHSYFIDKTKEGGSMDIRLEYEIKPILFEYIKDGVLIGEDIEKLIEDLEQSI